MSSTMAKSNPVKKSPPKKATSKKKTAVTSPSPGRRHVDPIAKVAEAVAKTSPENDMRARYAACVAEVNEVLRKYRCRIMPAINPVEPIGGEPTSKIMVSATWGIMPEA